jgi:hypothetical protein
MEDQHGGFMLVSEMRRRVVEIDQIVMELMIERAELQGKLEESDKFWDWETKHISRQMTDWWDNLQRSQKIE